MRIRTILAAGLLAGVAVPALAQSQSSATASDSATKVVQMKDTKGNTVGTVEVRPTAHGTLFVANLLNLPPGTHGFHVHERGVCDPPFQSAGGHFNPTDAKHGYMNADGPHLGDLPNVHVGENGRAVAEFYSDKLTIRSNQATAQATGQTTGGQTTGAASGGQCAAGNTGSGPYSLLTQNGTAIMIHANGDDYDDMSSAGGRIACGVIKPPS